MTKKLSTTLLVILTAATLLAALHPAELTVHNKGQRPLVIKLMKSGEDGKATKTHMEDIKSKGKTTVMIAEPGNYYLKTMTEFPGMEPFCTKGDPFKVYAGNDGYSILTITITVTEDSISSGDPAKQPISKSEFDRDVE